MANESNTYNTNLQIVTEPDGSQWVPFEEYNLLYRHYHEIVDWAWDNIPQSGNVEWDKIIDRHEIERS